ncbi:MAG: hypothetical protein RIR26_1996 [Pseudomonadota bacterium]
MRALEDVNLRGDGASYSKHPPCQGKSPSTEGPKGAIFPHFRCRAGGSLEGEEPEDMPVLRSRRYDAFEKGTPRDGLRGLPLQEFPWVLDTLTVETSQKELLWTVKVECLSAEPSGFGKKLNFVFRMTARLSPGFLKRFFQPATLERVRVLFSEDDFAVEEVGEMGAEGLLEELPRLSKESLNSFVTALNAQWPTARIQSRLRAHLSQSSPGGFGSLRT